MNRSMYLALLVVGLLIGAAGADEIFMANGDRVTGTVVKLTGGTLVVKTDFAGEMPIDITTVRTLGTEGAVEVHLKDGTILNQPIQAIDQDGRFAITTGPSLQAQTFAIADLVSINPPPKPKPKWTGSISAGVTITTGNTETETYNASVAAVRRSEKDRMRVAGDYAKGERENPVTGDDETIEDWWRATAQYDYFFSKKFFGFVSGRYEKDGIALLDRRVVVGAGAGYQWIESDRTNFATSVGVASVYEKFENADDGDDQVSLQAGYTFDHQINKSVKFVHDLTYFPSFEDFGGDYYLTTTGELRASLTKSMYANFKVICNYDETPANGRENTDVKYIFGLGMSF